MSATPRVDRAAELVAQITAILTASDLEHGSDIPVTTDAAVIDKTPDQRLGVVLVAPGPRLDFPAPGIVRTTWRIFVVARDTALATSWERIDSITQVLVMSDDGLPVESAAPGNLPRPDTAPQVPGYTLTLIEDHQF